MTWFGATAGAGAGCACFRLSLNGRPAEAEAGDGGRRSGGNGHRVAAGGVWRARVLGDAARGVEGAEVEAGPRVFVISARRGLEDGKAVEVDRDMGVGMGRRC